jgi:predicted AlkP superfamily pyrophosphatase or phosphodiesterase
LVKQTLAALLLAALGADAQPPAPRPPKPKAAAKSPAAPVPPRKLVVISIDGLDARFFRDADRFHIKIPTLRRLVATGLYAEVIGMAPTLTWPSHAMIATGAPPDQNGVPDNDLPGKPDDRFWFEHDLKSIPIWRAANQKGLKTATIYWPSTVDAHVDFNCPEYWEGPADNAVPFDQVAPRCTRGLIDRIARWDNSFVAPLWDDAVGIDVMRYLLTHEKLDLIMLHLPELDAEQHETGAMSIYARKVLENDDELLGAALQKITPDTVVAIVSDHGFDTVSYFVRPKVMLKAAGLSDAVIVKYGLIVATNARAAAMLRKFVGAPRSGIAREVPMLEVRKLAAAAEVANWVAAFDTPLGFVANEETRGAAVGAGNHKGVHGLWPTHDASRAVFILAGPSIKHLRLSEISILDEAPTFADVLGVKLPKAKGTSALTRVGR